MGNSHPARSSQSTQDEATRMLQAVRMLAAAFPRSAWRAQSDAAYTMALLSAGLTADEVNVAVRDLIRTRTELPTVADIITLGGGDADEGDHERAALSIMRIRSRGGGRRSRRPLLRL